MQFFRFVPSMAWLTPVVLWFGVGEVSKVLIIIYTTTFIVLINTMVVVRTSLQQAARRGVFGSNSREGVFPCHLPATLPFILTGMRLAMGNSFATVVAAEMIAADSGLGYLILTRACGWLRTGSLSGSSVSAR